MDDNAVFQGLSEQSSISAVAHDSSPTDPLEKAQRWRIGLFQPGEGYYFTFNVDFESVVVRPFELDGLFLPSETLYAITPEILEHPVCFLDSFVTKQFMDSTVVRQDTAIGEPIPHTVPGINADDHCFIEFQQTKESVRRGGVEFRITDVPFEQVPPKQHSQLLGCRRQDPLPVHLV
jgi:hypothetical protein